MVRLLNSVIKGIGYLLRVLLMATVLFITLQVFCRYALGSPLTWTEQLSRFFFIWMMMLGLPVLFHYKSFMAFDLILCSLPDKAQKITAILIKAGICAFAVFWFRGALDLCLGTANKLTSGVRIHYYWLYGAQLASSALVFWVMITQTVQEAAQLLRKTEAKAGERK